MPIDAKGRSAGRFVRRVQKELQGALVRSGLKQQQVAERLGVDRSIVNRRVTGQANLTLRSIADLAWAMDQEIVFALKPKKVDVSANEHPIVQEPLPVAIISSSAPGATPGLGKSHMVVIGGDAVAGPNTQSSAPSRNLVSSKVVRQHESA
ncbi:helix-turn-helix domain-containing protein [Rhizobium mesoamericanum]